MKPLPAAPGRDGPAVLTGPYAIAALLALSALLKLYHLTAPAVDWHSWNQITNLAQARYIFREGWSAFFFPRIDLYSSLDPGSDRTFQEMPLLHLMMAAGYHLIGGEAEWVGRVLNIAFSALGGVYLYRLCQTALSARAASLAVAVYAFSPMNLFYHRTIKSDVPFTVFMVVALYYFVCWLDQSRFRDGLLSGASLALAALFKPYALYMGVVFFYLILRRQGWHGVFTPAHIAIGVLCAAPPMAWIAFGWIASPIEPTQGENLVTTSRLLGPLSLLWTGEYYDRLQVRVSDTVLTPVLGLMLYVILGVAIYRGAQMVRGKNTASSPRFPDWWTGWMLGVAAYLLIVRHGNYQHDYYQMPLLPPLAVGAALGFDWTWERLAWRPRWGALTAWQWLMLALLALSFLYGLVRTYHRHALDMDSYRAGRAVAALRGESDKTLTFDQGGMRFNQMLYYTGGKGWRIREPIERPEQLRPFVERGARFIAISLSQADWEQGRAPLLALLRMERDGVLTRAAESSKDKDRNGLPRHWAVFRIVPEGLTNVSSGHTPRTSMEIRPGAHP